MTIQTTYSERIDAARDGLLIGSDYNTDTGVVETAAGISFGKAVSEGAAAGGVVLGGTLASFLGVSLRDVSVDPNDSDKFAQYRNAPVCRRGKVWVTVAEAVAVGGDVYFSGSDGSWGDTNASSKLGPVKGARWATAAGSGERALLELGGATQG